jgi:hypothetical protein
MAASGGGFLMAREIGGRFLDDQPVKGGLLSGRLRCMLCPNTGCFMGTCGSRWPVQGDSHPPALPSSVRGFLLKFF